MVVSFDAVTGLPLDDSYLTQYQIPLGSQPINLEELGALGRQSNWLYPDNLPGVVSRLQARDNTNPLNAQDLSTDGKRNLNVNIASGGGGTTIVGVCTMVLSISPISNPSSGPITSGDRQPVTWGFGTILLDIGAWVAAGTDPNGPNIRPPLARTYILATTIDVNASSGVAFDAALWIDVNGIDVHTIPFIMSLDPETGVGNCAVTLPLNLKLGDVVTVLVENNSTQPVDITNGSIALWGV